MAQQTKIIGMSWLVGGGRVPVRSWVKAWSRSFARVRSERLTSMLAVISRTVRVACVIRSGSGSGGGPCASTGVPSSALCLFCFCRARLGRGWLWGRGWLHAGGRQQCCGYLDALPGRCHHHRRVERRDFGESCCELRG